MICIFMYLTPVKVRASGTVSFSCELGNEISYLHLTELSNFVNHRTAHRQRIAHDSTVHRWGMCDSLVCERTLRLFAGRTKYDQILILTVTKQRNFVTSFKPTAPEYPEGWHCVRPRPSEFIFYWISIIAAVGLSRRFLSIEPFVDSEDIFGTYSITTRSKENSLVWGAFS